ncbi:unnamed protein product [Leuciscus chuanchicus]
MKTRWHWREGRADWSQQGEASGIITGSVRSGDAMSPYLHRHRTLCLPLSHGLSCSRPGEAGAFISFLPPSPPPPPIPIPVPDGVTPESYDAVIPPLPPECRGPYFRRAPCFLRPLPRLCSVSVCRLQVSKNKQEHKRNRRQSSGTDCEVERQRGRE